MTMVRATAIAAATLACLAFSSPAFAVKKQTKTVNGFKADVYTWTDSQGLKRSVALKKQGSGNDGNGGYAIQMTYEYLVAGVRTKATANAPKGDGFGYFVSHERYRAFSDGDSQTIAGKIFKTDDSPLGRGFPVSTSYDDGDKAQKSVTFSLTYPRYGTKKAGGIDTDTGEDLPKIGIKKKLFERYDLPVKITWTFEDGRTHPRIRTVVDLGKLPGPDRVSFDLRGPYGKLDFDEGQNAIQEVRWGDRFRFRNTTLPLTRNSAWTWNIQNTEARYIALIAGGKEMGLLEPKFEADSAINAGFAFGRGKTSATHDSAGAGCGGQELPCDYEWPYQASQYELPYDNPNGTTTSEKIAWGSTPFFGTSLSATYDGVASTPFNGFPKKKKISYDVCVVLGVPVGGTLTGTLLGPNYDCASAP